MLEAKKVIRLSFRQQDPKILENSYLNLQFDIQMMIKENFNSYVNYAGQLKNNDSHRADVEQVENIDREIRCD